MKTFLLAGHGGFHNRGCEAIMRATLALLRERFGAVRVILSSFSHEQDRRLDPGRDVTVVPAIAGRWSRDWVLGQFARRLGRARAPSRYDLALLRRPLHDADAVLSIGGDNYTTDYGHPSYFLRLNRLVRDARRPLVIWGASVGPFPPGPLCDEVMDSLRAAALITARESMTVEYLAGQGISGNVRQVADPAFLLPAEPVDISSFWPSGRDVIGLNLSPILNRYREDHSSAPIVSSVIQLARHCVHGLELGVVLIPHVTAPAGGDYAALQPIVEQLDCPGRVALMPPGYNAMQTKHVISRCRFLVAARTHATIAGFSSTVPTISLAYSQKAFGINRDIFGDLRYVVDVRTVTGAALISALDTLADGEQEVRAHLTAALPRITERARAAAQYLADAIGAPPAQPAIPDSASTLGRRG